MDRRKALTLAILSEKAENAQAAEDEIDHCSEGELRKQPTHLGPRLKVDAIQLFGRSYILEGTCHAIPRLRYGHVPVKVVRVTIDDVLPSTQATVPRGEVPLALG